MFTVRLNRIGERIFRGVLALLALNAALLPCARMGGGRTRRRLVGVAAVVILTVLSCAWSVARGGVCGNGPGRARVGGDGSENAPVSDDGAIAVKKGWDGWDGEAGHAPLVGERRRRRLDEGVARSERVASNPAWQALTRQATLRDDPGSCAGVCGLCTSSCCCDRDCRAVGDCCGDFEDVGVCQAQKDEGGGSVGDGTPPPSAPVGEVTKPPPAPEVPELPPAMPSAPRPPAQPPPVIRPPTPSPPPPSPPSPSPPPRFIPPFTRPPPFTYSPPFAASSSDPPPPPPRATAPPSTVKATAADPRGVWHSDVSPPGPWYPTLPPAPFPPLPGVPPFPLYLYTKLQAVPRCVRLFSFVYGQLN